MEGRITKLTVAGAVCYAAWGCLHVFTSYRVYLVGSSMSAGMAQGRVFQDAFNLFFFGATAIGVALMMNVRGSKVGYWINLGVAALADAGLILFVLMPGYMPLWPGVAGPLLWALGFLFTTLAYLRRDAVSEPTPSLVQSKLQQNPR